MERFFKQRQLVLCSMLALFFAVSTGCHSDSSADGTSTRKLVITGSSTVAPLVQEIALRFEKENPGTRVDVQTGGSSRGIRDSTRGVADIGMSSRHLNPEEATKLDSTVIAWDGVAFVVHQDNQVTELSKESLVKIYSGAANNWSAFGGKDERIVVSNRAEGRSELELVCEYLEIERGAIKADVVDGETQQSLKTVINNSKAITYTSVGAAQDAIARGQPLKLLPLEGVDASSDAVQSGKFPLARPLILVVPNQNGDQTDSLLNAFVQFASSTTVADAAVGLGYVPVSQAGASKESK